MNLCFILSLECAEVECNLRLKQTPIAKLSLKQAAKNSVPLYSQSEETSI